MKTNQILIRSMGEFQVAQRTSDGMFNATALLKQWNNSNESGKKLDHYFENKTTKEFINTILSKENLNTPNSVYLKTRGISGGTWMSPMLFIDFAMWINPSFKYDVIKFVYDKLIKYRNEAGDAYREMSQAVAKIVPKKDIVESISKTAQALNFVCFNKHETAIRNKQDETAMKELVTLEKEVTLLINVGHINTFDALLKYLRDKWYIKYRPALLGDQQ